jgi:hypothetical protein
LLPARLLACGNDEQSDQSARASRQYDDQGLHLRDSSARQFASGRNSLRPFLAQPEKDAQSSARTAAG